MNTTMIVRFSLAGKGKRRFKLLAQYEFAKLKGVRQPYHRYLFAELSAEEQDNLRRIAHDIANSIPGLSISAFEISYVF